MIKLDFSYIIAQYLSSKDLLLKFGILNHNFNKITLKLCSLNCVWIYKLLDEYISIFDTDLELNFNMKNDEECESQIKKYPWIIELDKNFK